MTSQTNMVKLTMPADIGEEKKFLSHCQKLIEGKLLNCYAKEVSFGIEKLQWMLYWPPFTVAT